jgi:hypothetical protein
LKALVEQEENLTCKDCIAAPRSAPTGKARNVSAKSAPAKYSSGKSPAIEKEGIRYSLGPPPTNVLPRMTCPHCWHVFPTDDALFISQHGELLGDPVLGPEAQLRFRPSRFNIEGEALDARDTPCQILACPRCHLSIPRGMTQSAPLFMSIIGAPGSGKSHLLASMTWELRRVLAEKFAIRFNDADASTNLSLNEYEQTLFLQDDMDQLVSIRKTELQGELYDQVRLGEQVINLPKPFLFTLRPTRNLAVNGARMRMVCLYDNAGEHFQPGMDTVSLPGTQHMAKSRVLWFVYDPTLHPRFREQCRSLSQDPQVYGAARTIRQELLLTEAACRIRRYTGLPADQRYDRPLVVIVSKADIWSQLLGVKLSREPLAESPTGDGTCAIDVDRVEKISAGLRKLLLMTDSAFVTAADDFCKHVVYIPVSALGRGPELEEETGMLGIRPRDIHPQWATVPFLYMFAKWSAGLISGVKLSAPSLTSPALGESTTVNVSPPNAATASDEPINVGSEIPSNGELLYTSAPRGLRPGSSGFCTVAMTSGMPASLVERLEMLSSYQPIFPAGSINAAKNPIVHAHWRVPMAGRARSVLSRIEFAGLDYTHRPNKRAYHLVVDPNQQPADGPAWAMLQPGVMQPDWNGEPELWAPTKSLPVVGESPSRCSAWEAATGDAGWGGIFAEAHLLDPSKISYLVYEVGFDPLKLLAEALALLPARVRWYVTFSTYFTELPAGLTCAWRCVVAGSAAAKDARRSASVGLVMHVSPLLGAPPNRVSTQHAREGKVLNIQTTGKSIPTSRPAQTAAMIPAMTGERSQIN